MTDNIEKKVAVDGPVANEGEHGSSPFSPGQVSPADPLGFGQRWTVARKREVVLRLETNLCPRNRVRYNHYNNHRYHESIGNVTPADSYFERHTAMIETREKIKKLTIQNRRLNHQRQAA